MRSPLARAARRLRFSWPRSFFRWIGLGRRIGVRASNQTALRLTRLEEIEAPSDTLSALLGELSAVGALAWMNALTPFEDYQQPISVLGPSADSASSAGSPRPPDLISLDAVPAQLPAQSSGQAATPLRNWLVQGDNESGHTPAIDSFWVFSTDSGAAHGAAAMPDVSSRSDIGAGRSGATSEPNSSPPGAPANSS